MKQVKNEIVVKSSLIPLLENLIFSLPMCICESSSSSGGQPCPWQGVGVWCSLRSLPTPVLWFCDSLIFNLKPKAIIKILTVTKMKHYFLWGRFVSLGLFFSFFCLFVYFPWGLTTQCCSVQFFCLYHFGFRQPPSVCALALLVDGNPGLGSEVQALGRPAAAQGSRGWVSLCHSPLLTWK